MRLRTLQIVAALGAVIAAFIAFMAVGATLASVAVAGLGSVLMAMIVYRLAHQVLSHRRYPAVRSPSA